MSSASGAYAVRLLASGAPPRVSSSRSASAPSARLQLADVAARDVGDEALGGARGHAQAALDLGDGLARLQALRDRDGVAQALGHQVGEAGHALALLAQAQVGERGLARVGADERVGKRVRAPLARVRGAAFDVLDADRA